jgi:putative tricarboxylic transport membrane protein
VWALIASLYIGNVMLLVLNLPMVGLWVKLLKIPKPQLYAGILIFATVGAYGMRQSAFDLVLLYAIGVLGVLMRRFDFPTAPVVVGMILGPLAEAQMRNAVSIGEGSFAVFVQRPMSLTLIIIVLAVLILPRVMKRRAAKLAAGSAPARFVDQRHFTRLIRIQVLFESLLPAFRRGRSLWCWNIR